MFRTRLSIYKRSYILFALLGGICLLLSPQYSRAYTQKSCQENHMNKTGNYCTVRGGSRICSVSIVRLKGNFSSNLIKVQRRKYVRATESKVALPEYTRCAAVLWEPGQHFLIPYSLSSVTSSLPFLIARRI